MTAGKLLDGPGRLLAFVVEHRLFVRVYLTARLFVVVGLLLYIIALLNRYHAEATAARQRLVDMQEQSERNRVKDALALRVAITDFELRTVRRWKALQDNNPGITVPVVTEPITGPDPGPMQRPTPTP